MCCNGLGPSPCPLKLGLSSVADGGRRMRTSHSCTSPISESHHFPDLLWGDTDALFMEGVQVTVLRWTPHWVLWRACGVSPLDTSLLQKAQFWLDSFQVSALAAVLPPAGNTPGWNTSKTVKVFVISAWLWLEKEMATHSSVLAWRIPGTGEPGGLPSMGSHRVGHDWSDLAAAAVWLWQRNSCIPSHTTWRSMNSPPIILSLSLPPPFTSPLPCSEKCRVCMLSRHPGGEWNVDPADFGQSYTLCSTSHFLSSALSCFEIEMKHAPPLSFSSTE